MWTQSEIWIFHHKSPFAHRNTLGLISIECTLCEHSIVMN